MGERRKLGPGIYADGEELHVELEEFIVGMGGDPASPRDRATAERAIRTFGRAHEIPVEAEERPYGA